MNKPPQIHTVKVFVDSEDQYGNPVGIVIDESGDLDPNARQSIAKKLNFSETVFINDLKSGSVTIFNPETEVNFAGHALVGTAWFINKTRPTPLSELTCAKQKVSIAQNDFTWITAPLAITPPWNKLQLGSKEEVEILDKETINKLEHTIVWAWIDKEKGIIRARTFAPDWGIPEDEANGSGSMQLCADLKVNLEIIHGKGSVIYVTQVDTENVKVGGRCYQEI